MKKVFIIAAVLIAALPMAHASGILYNFAGSSQTVTPGTAAALTPIGYRSGIVSSTGPYSISGATSSGVSVTYNTNGMGVNYTNDPDPYEIALINGTNNFVVIDFSSPIGLGDTFATINLDNVTSGYIVYEGAKAGNGLSQLTVGAASASGARAKAQSIW